jgi:hypothetical protein
LFEDFVRGHRDPIARDPILHTWLAPLPSMPSRTFSNVTG